MKKISKLAVAFLAMSTLAWVGCNSTPYSLAPVSGKVTSKDQPVSGLRIIFTPLPNAANTDPGPWSTAVTNAQGEFSLETRHNKNGAAVGNHTVSFEYEDAGASDLDELNEDLAAAEEDGSDEEAAAIRKQIADIEQQAMNRPRIAEDFTLEFTVPPGGTKKANFTFE
jgi:hypothetical protein